MHTDSNPRLLLTVPVICSMVFAACSEVADTPGTHQAVNLQSAVLGHTETGDNVTIGPTTTKVTTTRPYGATTFE
jgi:hypothetical protein